MRYYKSLNFIPVFNYFYADKDIRYLLKLDDYEEMPDLTEEELEELKLAYHEMYLEQFEKSKKINVIEEKRKQLARLINKHTIIESCLDLMRFRYMPCIEFNFAEIEETLREYGYGIEYKNKRELFEQLELKHKRLEGVRQTIKQKEKEFNTEKLSNDNVDLQKNICMIEKIIGIKIDEFKDSAAKYFKYVELANKINKDASTRKANTRR